MVEGKARIEGGNYFKENFKILSRLVFGGFLRVWCILSIIQSFNGNLYPNPYGTPSPYSRAREKLNF
jgi:hypothetical protein